MTATAALGRVTEVVGILGLDSDRAAQALDFHGAIRDAVERHRRDAEDPRVRLQDQTAGRDLPAHVPVRRLGGRVLEILRSYRGEDQGGDGTVPTMSATPLELSNQDLEVYVRERHASLQNADFSLDQLVGVIRRQRIDQTQAFAPGTGISLDLADAYLSREPVTVRALPEAEWAVLTVRVADVATGADVAMVECSRFSGHRIRLPID